MGSSATWSDSDSESEAASWQRGRSRSVADGTADTESYGTSLAATEGESESVTHGGTRGVSLARGISTTHSKSVARSQQESIGVTKGNSIGFGQSTSNGWSEAVVPILATRPGGVHSKENVLYQAAQTLRSLPTGTCFINWVDHNGMQNAMLRVPQLPAATIADDAFDKVRNTVFRASPSALPLPDAEQHLAERRRQLLAAANDRLVKLEPPEPATFRVPMRKGNGRPKGEV